MKFSTTVVALASVGAVQAAHIPDCDVFCADAATACAGTGTAAFPFTDAADCKAKCGGWKMSKPGLPSTTDAEMEAAGQATKYTNAGTDTFFCRQYHLSVAKMDSTSAATHCPHIADASTGVCDKHECDVFCTDYTATCSGTTDAFYANVAACKTDCMKMFTENRRGPEYGRAGNTYGCRRYHLDVAMTATDAATTHCPHAGPTGGGVCIDNPANFCSLFTKACVEAKTPVENLVPYTNCVTQFTAFDGTHDNMAMANPVTSGTSRACRQYHLNVAYSTFDTTHCLHAQADGGGVCVTAAPTAASATDSSATRSFAGVAAVASLAVALLV